MGEKLLSACVFAHNLHGEPGMLTIEKDKIFVSPFDRELPGVKYIDSPVAVLGTPIDSQRLNELAILCCDLALNKRKTFIDSWLQSKGFYLNSENSTCLIYLDNLF